MTVPTRTYLLDTNVFVEAHRRYYGFDICPGFWHWLLHHQQANHIVSIDRVRQELKTGDVLDQWIKDTAPSDLFHSTQDAAVIAHFASMMGWVQASTQFKPAAKSQFANVADGWLAAYAKAHGHVLVTHEEYAPDAKKSVRCQTSVSSSESSIRTPLRCFGSCRPASCGRRHELGLGSSP